MNLLFFHSDIIQISTTLILENLFIKIRTAHKTATRAPRLRLFRRGLNMMLDMFDSLNE